MTPSKETILAQSRDVLGHPRGLFVLFFTEMWERFSYYGMRALLVLYMTEYLFVEVRDKGKYVWGLQGFQDFLTSLYGPMTIQRFSSEIYGSYTALVYLTPVFGGLLADRYLGRRNSVYIGGALMAIGHFLMAIESLFLPALLFLILGNGFFKPNISTQVGELYTEHDHRRDKAFMIFYMGINLGAFFSPLICGTLGQKVGWHYGFAAAGVGMLLGLLVYHFGRGTLPVEVPLAKNPLVNAEASEGKLTSDDYKRIFVLFFLCIVNIAFWGVYEQQGNVLQLWAEHNTDWNFFGITLPSTWYQAFNPFMIVALTPLLGMLWTKQASKGKEPGSISKMGIGCFLAAIAYIVMFFAARIVGTGQGSLLWLTGTTLLFTIGELYISPIGLSLVTKLAPAKVISMLMGVWLLSSFFGNYLAGHLGGFYESMGAEHFFILLSILAGAAAVVFFASSWPLKKYVD